MSELLQEFLEFLEGAGPAPAEALLDRVLEKSRQLTGAEAGTIFVVRGRGRQRRLEPASVQNDAVEVEPADFLVPITSDSVAGHTAVTGETVFVEDLYAIDPSLPYRFDRTFDDACGYRSRTMLSFPLLDFDRKLIGVVQLINRRGPSGEGPLAFGPAEAGLIVPINHIVGGVVERSAMLDRISRQNVRLRERNRTLRRQRARIAALQDETEEAFRLSIGLLARAAELHDLGTALHVERVNEYSYEIAHLIGQPRGFCDEIRYSAQLHDVGKMSIDIALLRKAGPLDEGEQAEMRRHPEYGWDILSASDRLRMAAEIALCHHERWDGGGYPRGLRGDEIPLAARIVTLADIYDVLRCERPYKPPYDHDRAVRVLLEGDDRLQPHGHLDPGLLRLFAEHHPLFDDVWRRVTT